MKNAYLLAPALLTGALAFGQIGTNMPTQNADVKPGKVTDKLVDNGVFHNFGKAAGDLIYSEDFNGSLNGWGGNPSTQDSLWKIDFDGPSGTFAGPTEVINSTTAGNGFAIMDGDAANPNAPYIDKVAGMNSPAIDMTGISNALVTFEHRYRHCCSNDFYPRLLVSTDDFATSTEYDVTIPGMDVNAVPDTYRHKVDISDFLATATNLSNLKIRFFFDGTGGTSHYYWQVDDIAIYESFNYDSGMGEVDFFSGNEGIPYYRVPVSQIVPVTFTTVATNYGVQNYNEVLTVTADNGGGSVASPGLVLANGESDTLITAQWTPPATVATSYGMTYSLDDPANADEEPSDNTILDAIEITSRLYGVDNGSNGGTITNFASNSGQPFKIGNQMEIMQDGILTQMEIDLGAAATNVDQIFSGEIQKYDATLDEFVYLEETEEITVTATNNNTTVTLNLNNPAFVTAGDLLLVLARHNGSPTGDEIGFRSAQKVTQGIVLGYDATGGLFALTDPNAVRARVLFQQEDASVSELNKNFGFGLWPNPTAGTADVNISLDAASTVEVVVTDFTGKVVSATTSELAAGGHTQKVDVSAEKAGVYFVTVKSANGVATKKLIKQ